METEISIDDNNMDTWIVFLNIPTCENVMSALSFQRKINIESKTQEICLLS